MQGGPLLYRETQAPSIVRLHHHQGPSSPLYVAEEGDERV